MGYTPDLTSAPPPPSPTIFSIKKRVASVFLQTTVPFYASGPAHTPSSPRQILLLFQSHFKWQLLRIPLLVPPSLSGVISWFYLPKDLKIAQMLISLFSPGDLQILQQKDTVFIFPFPTLAQFLTLKCHLDSPLLSRTVSFWSVTLSF